MTASEKTSLDWKNSSPTQRMEELERLRADYYRYDVNNPPRMNRTSSTIKILSFEEHNQIKHSEWQSKNPDLDPSQSPYLVPAN